MCCDQLLCARCAAPVAEARCPVCRAARAELHGTAGPSFATIAAIVLAVMLVAAALHAIVVR